MLLGVDVGGTFTDAVLVGDDGAIHTAKVATTPSEQARGVLDAVALVLRRAGAHASDVRRFAHGMTVTTNALLERRTARTALVATDGFTDVIALGRQARPHLYRLCDAAPAPLVPDELRFAAPERIAPDGVLRALAPDAADTLVQRVAASEPEAVAVALLHSYADSTHERMLGELLAKRLPDVAVSLSSELVGTFREYERTATTVLDAALSPLLSRYLRRLSGDARAAGLPEPQIMQSSGGLTDLARASSHAALTVLSGPAGGVGGAQLLAALAGQRDVLCFDMGGTSCDVCLIDGGGVAETAERSVAGRPLALPALDIHTVGAGGGSIAWRDGGGALRVGPVSAGADPGPACYGRGGQLPTVTDANLLLGRLSADAPLAGELVLDRAAAERAVATLARELGLDMLACASGIVRVAESEMLGALRQITVQRGIDPRAFTLMPFGGAGPLHACSMARELGIRRVLCPRACGVLSALGLAAAAARRDVSRTVMLTETDLTAQRLGELRDALLSDADAALGAERSRARVVYELRYRGQAFELAVEHESADPDQLREAFAAAHEQRYGYRDDDAPIELVNVRASVWAPAPALELRGAGDSLATGARVAGPSVHALDDSTLYLPSGWSGVVDEHGSILLADDGGDAGGRDPAGGASAPGAEEGSSVSELDPIELQVVVGALRSACEEMGVALIRSAHSSNIKERRDCSTALFDVDGQMVMQAEHIPVHLGSMPAAVAAVRDERHAPGVSWILNDPFAGGTHLPDITVVTPVFVGGRDGALIGFAASRAHHADVGGRVPGSMPADSRTLADEGVVISPRPLDAAAIDELVQRMRQPQERRADLRAQLAANAIGARRLAALAERLGARRLRLSTDSVLDYAERRTRACLAALGDGERLAHDVLEARGGDLVLRLRAHVDGERLLLDFSGSAAQHDGNLNCPLAVTRSACLFAVRVLTDPDIPPSAGAYRPIDVRAPEGSLLNARAGAAVAAGNVETSSRVADLVLGAFGRACGQGTMNNLTLGADSSSAADAATTDDGRPSFAYYETLGGGQGACVDADGPSGVHVAMSNTLNTPVEALEREFPLRVVRYELRRGSGGAGEYRGGDGVVRELQALREMSFSLIAERRRHGPPGAHGGEPGARGRDLLDGVLIPGKCAGTLLAGQRLRIETPGGGGFGRPDKADQGE